MAETYPAEVTTFKVVGRLARGMVDSADEGAEPDLVPIEGAKITFTPTMTDPSFTVPGAVEPLIVFQESVSATTDENGYLKLPDADGDEFGVILAYGHSPEISPSGWNWQVKISVGGTFKDKVFAIAGLPGGEINLANAVPVPPAPGVELAAWVTIQEEIELKRVDAALSAAAAHEAELVASEALTTLADALVIKDDARLSADSAFLSLQGAETAAAAAEQERIAAEAAKNLALAGQFAGSPLGSTSNLNDITTPGVYRVSNSSYPSLALNYPQAAPATGILEVFSPSNSPVNILQRWTAQSGSTAGRGSYLRRLFSGSWSSWVFEPTQKVEVASGQPGVLLSLWDDVNNRDQPLYSISRDLGTVDLDVVVIPGQYRQTDGANATTTKHYPIEGPVGILEVFSWTGANSNSVVQRYTPTGGPNAGKGVFQRRWNGSWNTWTFLSSQRVDQTAGRAIYDWDPINSREQLTYGDTGKREMSPPSEWTGAWYLRRQHAVVWVSGSLQPVDRSTSPAAVLTLPPGFVRPGSWTTRQAFNTQTGAVSQITDRLNAISISNPGGTAGALSFDFTFMTDQGWPASLPGVASGSIPNA